MNIDELLDQMDELLDDAFNVPFSGGKRVVDVDRVRGIIDDIRLNMPTEIRQAKAITADRIDIIKTAKKEAEDIVKRAEERARALVSQEAVVRAAQQHANEINAAAQTHSRELRAKTVDYCEDVLRKTEEQLAKSAVEVKSLRTSMRRSASSAASAGTARVTPRLQNPQNNQE